MVSALVLVPPGQVERLQNCGVLGLRCVLEANRSCVAELGILRSFGQSTQIDSFGQVGLFRFRSVRVSCFKAFGLFSIEALECAHRPRMCSFKRDLICPFPVKQASFFWGGGVWDRPTRRGLPDACPATSHRRWVSVHTEVCSIQSIFVTP